MYIMCHDALAPWDENPGMRDKLKEATYRYALVAARDQNQIPDSRSLRTSDNLLGWNDDDALAFIQAATGYQASLCRMWLVYEWDIDVPLLP